MGQPGACRGAVFSQTSKMDQEPVRRIPAASSEAGSSPLKASTSSSGMTIVAANRRGSRAHNHAKVVTRLRA